MEISRLPAEARRRRSSEIRAFLRSRRSRLTPEEVGMPSGGGRRSPGLRREEVAVLAGVGVSWYTWLEQGRAINVSAGVLDAVARVLRLTPAEREHLYLLAGQNPPQAPVGAGSVPPGLRRVIDSWLPRPAYVIDRHWNLIAVNRAARLVFGYGDGDHNCLVSFFVNVRHRSTQACREDAARAMAGQFRADAARYPDDPEFERMAAELCSVSPEFADVWAGHDIGSAAQGVKVIEHPGAGQLAFEYTTLPLPDLPGHRLLLYVPPPGTGTESRLASLLTGSQSAAD
ncbi:helix-turn-helix transcriptional regulator [Streptomyces uncialis]|uniref:helix-turn-helix transcriptional regulator n=1 Tax=Streptomyces uncialis TaxID=1048205 RepID=UPI0037B0CA6D